MVFCTNPQSVITTVTIAPQLSLQSGSRSVRSLFVQTNPYAGDKKLGCHFEVKDVKAKTNLKYALFTKVPVILGRAPFSVDATSLTSGILNFGKREQLTGQYVRLHISMIPTYVSANINASLPCTEAVRLELSGETDKIFERHLQQTEDRADCRNYLIPLWTNNKTNNGNSNNNNNNTHLIYLPKIRLLRMLDDVIQTRVKMGKLSAFVFNRDIGNFLCIVKIKLHGTCAQHCNHITVQTVYRALVSHNTVSLQWNLVLNTGDFQVTLLDVPMSGVLLYVTSLNEKCIHTVCSANIDIQYTTKQNHVLPIWNDGASDQTPFAEYHLLWSHGDYTWDEAEEICQELGGMHLPSISSEKEYLLITRMLLGSTYHVFDTDEFHVPILTPCVMGSPLCVIYIGLKRQVSQQV